jgi:hypothetical protein
MTTFLILAPYGAFAFLMLVTSAASSLFAAAAICLAVIAFDIRRGRSVKLLGAGTALTFAVLGCYQVLGDAPLSNLAVKIAVDAGLFLVGALSLVIGKPFTLQYAREMADAETARLPGFVTANYVITSVWVAAFLLMVAANWLLLNLPDLPLWSGLVIAFAIRNPALYFSKWYPAYRQRKYSPSLATETH